MASANSLHSEGQLRCFICQYVFTDPITTPCGHNFCNTCITQYWDNKEPVCQCPLCNETFDKRPRFSINKILSEMADQFRMSKQVKQTSSASKEPDVSCMKASKPEEAFCDICKEQVKAVKTCLTCLKSMCETHMARHDYMTKFTPHLTMCAVRNPNDYICKKHDKPLELFCMNDRTRVCLFCNATDHEAHKVVNVKEEFDRKMAELGKTEDDIQKMIQDRQVKIQEFQQSVEFSKKTAAREIRGSVQVFNDMISCIERSQAELIDVIEEKQKTGEEQAEVLIKELEQEITELKKKSSEMKKLSPTEDYLLNLENAQFTSFNTIPPTKDWTKVSVHQSYVGTVRTAVAQLEKTLSKEMKKLCDELRRIQQYSVDVTLDPDTAHRRLFISQDGKEVHNDNIKKNLPDSAVRFTTCFSAVGKEGFSSGRFYYEVQVKDKTEWYLGVVSESVDRTREITPRGYWTLRMMNGNKYHALAYPNVSVAVKGKLQKVGVFVDYDESLVSFYDVEARVHIYSFTACTFTDKIYPVFNTGPYYTGKNCAPLIITHTG